jgi:hypothetical protein
MGLLPADWLEYCDVAVTLPDPVIANALEDEQVRDIRYRNKAISPQTYATQCNLNYDDEQANWKEAVAADPMYNVSALPGMDDIMQGRLDQTKAVAGSDRQESAGYGLMESANWDESKHPRADDGKFGSGGGGSKEKGADDRKFTDKGGEGDGEKESFSQMMDRIAKKREANHIKWEHERWSSSEEARLAELTQAMKKAPLDENDAKEQAELSSKYSHLKRKKMLNSNTGVKRGSLKQIDISTIDLQGQRMDEVSPLKDGNKDAPIIVAKQGDKYKILDGFGRTNGMLNAGHSKIHAIVAADSDIDKFNGVTSDNDEFAQYMYDKYAKGIKIGSQGSLVGQ